MAGLKKVFPKLNLNIYKWPPMNSNSYILNGKEFNMISFQSFNTTQQRSVSLLRMFICSMGYQLWAISFEPREKTLSIMVFVCKKIICMFSDCLMQITPT